MIVTFMNHINNRGKNNFYFQLFVRKFNNCYSFRTYLLANLLRYNEQVIVIL